MLADWLYSKKGPNDKNRNPGQGDLFRCESIPEPGQALIREAIQNSLDAKRKDINGPVKVRLFVGSHDKGSSIMGRYITDIAWKHIFAEENKLKNLPDKNDACPFLVYEDFNTTGLVGDFARSDPSEDKNNAYYYFMRAEKDTPKETGTRGRHGDGKYVFALESDIRTFFVITNRVSDGRTLIAGQSILNFHNCEKVKYTPDGWWGIKASENHSEPGLYLPVESDELFAQIKRDFNLARSGKESGLSIVVPYIDPCINFGAICRLIILEYALPILRGDLIAEIGDGHDRLILDDYDALKNAAANFFDVEKLSDILDLLELMSRVVKDDCIKIEIPAQNYNRAPRWDKNYLNESLMQDIKKALKIHDKIVHIRAKLYISRSREKLSGRTDYKETHFDMYLKHDESESNHVPQFIRQEIRVPGNAPGPIKGRYGLIVIDDDLLADCLGSAENPAHTQWLSGIKNFKGEYETGLSILKFVIGAFEELGSLLASSNENEINKTALLGLLYIELPKASEDVPATDKLANKGNKNNAGNGEVHLDVAVKLAPPEPPVPVPPVPVPPEPTPDKTTFDLQKIPGGFILSGSGVCEEQSSRLELLAAYATASGSDNDAMSKHHKNDFDFGSQSNISRQYENARECLAHGNKLIVEVFDGQFMAKYSGFDTRRDLIVLAKEVTE